MCIMYIKQENGLTHVEKNLFPKKKNHEKFFFYSNFKKLNFSFIVKVYLNEKSNEVLIKVT